MPHSTYLNLVIYFGHPGVFGWEHTTPADMVSTATQIAHKYPPLVTNTRLITPSMHVTKLLANMSMMANTIYSRGQGLSKVCLEDF